MSMKVRYSPDAEPGNRTPDGWPNSIRIVRVRTLWERWAPRQASLGMGKQRLPAAIERDDTKPSEHEFVTSCADGAANDAETWVSRSIAGWRTPKFGSALMTCTYLWGLTS